jgi:rubrerythrin
MQFSAVEICKIGVEVERNGKRFYTQAAGKVADPALQKLFADLAKAEAVHEKMYLKLQEQLEASGEDEEECCFDQEYSMFLQALANSRVFTPDNTVDMALAKIDRPQDLILIAMGFEKDAILWFTEMRSWVSDEEKPVIEEFISYEKEHLSTLMGVLATL